MKRFSSQEHTSLLHILPAIVDRIKNEFRRACCSFAKANPGPARQYQVSYHTDALILFKKTKSFCLHDTHYKIVYSVRLDNIMNNDAVFEITKCVLFSDKANPYFGMLKECDTVGCLSIQR